jgi:hypothetical protein
MEIKIGTVLQLLNENNVTMENSAENNSRKRRRIVVKKGPELVRSVKAGQTSALTWEKTSSPLPRIWKFDFPSAA